MHYDDGDKEWTNPAALAVPSQPTGPDARPTKVAACWGSHLSWLIPVGIGIAFVILRGGCR